GIVLVVVSVYQASRCPREVLGESGRKSPAVSTLKDEHSPRGQDGRDDCSYWCDMGRWH
ncbi:hypothetical protein ElyMa_003619900, partial [Elysia marginata]